MSRTNFDRSFACMRIAQLTVTPFPRFTVVIKSNGVAFVLQISATAELALTEELCMYLRTFSERENAALLLKNITDTTTVADRVAVYAKVMGTDPDEAGTTKPDAAVVILEALGYEWTGTEWVQS